MPASASAPARAPAQVPRKRNTLQILKNNLYLLWGLDALLLIASIGGVRIHRHAMQTVGKDSAPSIVAAQHIRTALADMDANAANEMLGPPGKMPDAVKAFEARRAEAAKAIITAAENITFGDAERIPIHNLQISLGTYLALIQKTRDLHERADPKTVAAYLDAARVLDDTLLPAAQALDKANMDVLERTYERQARTSRWARFGILAGGVYLIGVLWWVQTFLSSRTRRIFNPALLAATLLTVLWLAYTLRATGAESHALKIAREDAFTSIHALWQARAIAYSANADESRYLLDAAHAAEHEAAFFAKTAQLAKSQTGTTFDTLLARAEKGQKLDGFSGHFVDELNNITFQGEREAAYGTLFQFVKYYEVDRRIRDLNVAGKRNEAIALCLGTQKGQSNWAFDQFDRAAGKTLDINQKEFDKAVAGGLDALSNFEVKAAILAIIFAGLVYAGLLARIREYS